MDVPKGLAGVAVEESEICRVDGDTGDIWYRGYNVDDLVESVSYEETLALLWNGDLPTRSERKRLREQLAAHRDLPPAIERTIADVAAESEPMDVIRSAVSLLPCCREDSGEDHTPERACVDIVATLPTILGHAYRKATGSDSVSPDRETSHAEHVLTQVFGEPPSDQAVAAMDDALVLYAEHGLNASTFSARVTTSTGASVYAAITSSLGTLEGALHGGAANDVVDVLDAIDDPEAADDWVADRIDDGEHIPGFGHRVYETTDPRCDHFRRHVEALGDEEDARRLAIADALREAVESRLAEKGVAANTDLYSGLLFDVLGFPADYSTALFGLARTAGWTAHVKEQRADNRLIRPRLEYVGDIGRDVVPLDERSPSA